VEVVVIAISDGLRLIPAHLRIKLLTLTLVVTDADEPCHYKLEIIRFFYVPVDLRRVKVPGFSCDQHPLPRRSWLKCPCPRPGPWCRARNAYSVDGRLPVPA